MTKFLTLNNKEIKIDIDPTLYKVKNQENARSSGQYNLGMVIQEIYGSQALLLEEFPVPGERLFLDFLLLHYKLAFEYHGSQHDVFNAHFHYNREGFERSKSRDDRKLRWCELNNITLIEVRNSEITSDELRVEIERRYSDGESIR